MARPLYQELVPRQDAEFPIKIETQFSAGDSQTSCEDLDKKHTNSPRLLSSEAEEMLYEPTLIILRGRPALISI